MNAGGIPRALIVKHDLYLERWVTDLSAVTHGSASHAMSPAGPCPLILSTLLVKQIVSLVFGPMDRQEHRRSIADDELWLGMTLAGLNTLILVGLFLVFR